MKLHRVAFDPGAVDHLVAHPAIAEAKRSNRWNRRMEPHRCKLFQRRERRKVLALRRTATITSSRRMLAATGARW